MIAFDSQSSRGDEPASHEPASPLYRLASDVDLRPVLPKFDRDGSRVEPPERQNPWESLTDKEQAALFLAALSHLPPTHAAAIWCDANGSLGALALVLNRPLSEAKLLLHEARQALMSIASSLRAAGSGPGRLHRTHGHHED